MSDVVDNAAEGRFEMALGEDELAVAYYLIQDGRYLLRHTEVPQHLSGQGIGSRLAEGVYALVRASGKRAIAQCPFMAAYAARHSDAMALLDG